MRSRGLVLDEMAARHRVASTTENPEILALTTSLASARQRLAAPFVRGIRDDPPERYRRLLDQARGEKDRAERDLAAKSARFRDDQDKDRIGVAELMASLPREPRWSDLPDIAVTTDVASRRRRAVVPGICHEGRR